MPDEPMTTPTTPEGRLYDAGFTRRLEYWVPPGSDDALSLNDAIARLDSGNVGARSSIVLPDTGVRALPDSLWTGSARRSRMGNRPRRLGWWRRQK